MVARAVAKAEAAVREGLRDDLRDLPDLVVLGVAADIEDLAVDHVAGSLQHAVDRAADIEDMDERAPRPAVAVHPDHLLRPRMPGQVVDHKVKALPGRGAERGRVPQEGRREVVGGHRPDIALHEHLALGVCRQGLEPGRLRAVLVAPRTVDAARGHVDEPLHAGFPGECREPDAAEVVDLEGDVRVELPDRIIRELGKMHDGIESAQVLHRQVPDVLVEPGRRPVHAVVQPAHPMEAAVDPDDVVPLSEQVRREDRPDVPLAPGDQDSHQLHTFHGAVRGRVVRGKAPHRAFLELRVIPCLLGELAARHVRQGSPHARVPGPRRRGYPMSRWRSCTIWPGRCRHAPGRSHGGRGGLGKQSLLPVLLPQGVRDARTHEVQVLLELGDGLYAYEDARDRGMGERELEGRSLQ